MQYLGWELEEMLAASLDKKGQTGLNRRHGGCVFPEHRHIAIRDAHRSSKDTAGSSAFRHTLQTHTPASSPDNRSLPTLLHMYTPCTHKQQAPIPGELSSCPADGGFLSASSLGRHRQLSAAFTRTLIPS